MRDQALEGLHAAQLEEMQHQHRAPGDLLEQQVQYGSTAGLSEQTAAVQTDSSLADAVHTAHLEASEAEGAALRRLLGEAEDRHREELQTLSRRHAETLRALQDEWEETASAARDQAAALQRRLEAAEAAAAAPAAPVQSVANAETDGGARQGAAAVDPSRAAADREAECAAHAEELEALREEHEATLNGLAALHAAAFTDASQAHAAGFARAEARHTVPMHAVFASLALLRPAACPYAVRHVYLKIHSAKGELFQKTAVHEGIDTTGSTG